MKIVVIFLFIVFMVNLFLMLVKFFKFEPNKVILSRWSKLFLISSAVLIFTIFLSAYSENKVTNLDYMPFWVGMSVLFIYGPYCAIMFCYGYDEEKWFWFNGLYIRKIHVNTLERIIFLKQNKKVTKFSFVSKNKTIKMRNDLGIEDLVTKFAKKNRIPTIIST